MYLDHRTGYFTFGLIVFRGATDDHSFSPEHFAAHSEHITLESAVDDDTGRTFVWFNRPATHGGSGEITAGELLGLGEVQS